MIQGGGLPVDHGEARRGWVLTPCAGRRRKTHSHTLTHTQRHTHKEQIFPYTDTQIRAYTQRQQTRPHIYRGTCRRNTQMHTDMPHVHTHAHPPTLSSTAGGHSRPLPESADQPPVPVRPSLHRSGSSGYGHVSPSLHPPPRELSGLADRQRAGSKR